MNGDWERLDFPSPDEEPKKPQEPRASVSSRRSSSRESEKNIAVISNGIRRMNSATGKANPSESKRMENYSRKDSGMKPKTEVLEQKQNNEKKAPHKNKGLKYVFVRFAQKSTMPGITLIYNSIRPSRKMIWFVFLIVGLGLSIFQSKELIENYLRRPSFIIEVEKLNRSLYLPSLTFCPSNIINWEKVTKLDHPIRKFMEENYTQWKEENYDEFTIRSELNDLLLTQLNSLDFDERLEIMTDIVDWLLMLIITDADGRSFYQFKGTTQRTVKGHRTYSPQYGFCYTFNPGFTEESKLRMSRKSRFLMLAIIKKEQEFPYLVESPSITLSIHSPASAPVLEWNKNMDILPGENLQIAIKVMDVKRLPSPYASNCNDNEDDLAKLISDSPYQSEETPYAYSREECMATCILKYLLQKFGCYWADVAMKNNSETHTLCASEQVDAAFAEADGKCTNICPKPCRELIYDWNPKSSGLLKRQSKLLHDLFGSALDIDMKDAGSFFALELHIDSNIYIYAEETEKYKLEDLLGSIGGTFGLWIGLSFLSVLELFELVLNIATVLIRDIKCEKK